MDFLGDLVAWLSVAEHWIGPRGILFRTYEHTYISIASTAAGAAVAMPPALLLAHYGRGAFLSTALVNVGRAVPSFGIVVLAAPITLAWGLGLGAWPTFFALFALTLPPVFTNSYTAVRGVDPATVEAARGMGMTETEILLAVEVPSGAPVIIAGVRVAFVQVIATATIGAVLPFGGLGRFIIDGFAKTDEVEVFVGAVCVALLALGAERALTLVQRRFLPAGVGRVAEPVDPVPSLIDV